MKGTAKGGAPAGEFLVLGNAISGILRQSQRVLMSHFLKLKFHYFCIKI